MRWLKAWFMRAGAAIDLQVLRLDRPVTETRRGTAGVSGRASALAGIFGCVVMLGGCETSMKLGDVFGTNSSDEPQTTATIGPQTTASAPRTADQVNDQTGEGGDGGPLAPGGLLGSDTKDDLNLGKKYYRMANHGLAERYFRKAVELHPRDAEAWLGLAASYDQLRRFELADRAYGEVFKIVGKTPEVLNNQGYSYMLRGEYRRARQTLLQARAMDRGNPFVQNNLDLLAKSSRKRKAVDN